jgi:hypothetical protein
MVCMSTSQERSGGAKKIDLLFQTDNLSGNRIVLLHGRRDVRDIATAYTQIGRTSLGDVGH